MPSISTPRPGIDAVVERVLAIVAPWPQLCCGCSCFLPLEGKARMGMVSAAGNQATAKARMEKSPCGFPNTPRPHAIPRRPTTGTARRASFAYRSVSSTEIFQNDESLQNCSNRARPTSPSSARRDRHRHRDPVRTDVVVINAGLKSEASCRSNSSVTTPARSTRRRRHRQGGAGLIERLRRNRARARRPSAMVWTSWKKRWRRTRPSSARSAAR